MEIYVKNIQKAEEKINKIERLIVLSQVSKNKQLMLITLEEIEKALKDCISSALHFDFKLKRVRLYKDPYLNLKTFKNKSSKNFSINPQELSTINEVLLASREHKKSSMEFMKQEELIIMSENQNYIKLSMEKLSNFLTITKGILKKIKLKING